MVNQHYLDILEQGAMAWNRWRKSVPEKTNNLSETQQKLLEGELGETFLDLLAKYLETIELDGANLHEAQLEGIDFRNVQLNGADLSHAQLKGANLIWAQLQGADLSHANLEGAKLEYANLEGANLFGAKLKGAKLGFAKFQGANLGAARLEGADLKVARLEGADLRDAFLADEQHIGPQLVDVHWGDTNLTVVNWSLVNILGDEYAAKQRKRGYQIAVRANRQLAVALQAQGLNEDAARFAYRAQVLQRKALSMQLRQWKWMEHVEKWIQNVQIWRHFLTLWQSIQMSGLWEQVVKLGRWINGVSSLMQKVGAFLFSFFLDLLAGYGYRPSRAFFWYLFVVVSFAAAYSVFGHLPTFPDALVFSLMSFHGRGFFPSLSGETNLHNPLVVLAAFEAVVGLFIEISFIATFTKRFFGS